MVLLPSPFITNNVNITIDAVTVSGIVYINTGLSVLYTFKNGWVIEGAFASNHLNQRISVSYTVA